jgi:hypothetical protein
MAPPPEIAIGGEPLIPSQRTSNVYALFPRTNGNSQPMQSLSRSSSAIFVDIPALPLSSLTSGSEFLSLASESLAGPPAT